MLNINLKGIKAIIAGIGDDQGFGRAIVKALAEAGAEIVVSTWTPILKIFTQNLEMGRFNHPRQLSNGSKLEFLKIYPLDAPFDKPGDVPEEIKENKRYKDVGGYIISEVADAIGEDFSKIDIFIHSLTNGPEIQKPLLETSRKGYLALSSYSNSFVSLQSNLGPYMNKNGSALSLTYATSERVVPGSGRGISSAKVALESDTRTLAKRTSNT